MVRRGSVDLDPIVEKLLSVGYVDSDELGWLRPTFDSINTDEFKRLIALLYPWHDQNNLRIISIGEFNGDECYALCNTAVMDLEKAQALVTQTIAKRASGASRASVSKP